MTGQPVIEALISAKVSGMSTPPRSWGHAEKVAFLKLPPDLQAFYSKREAQRDREVRLCQHSAAEARKELAETKQQLAEAQRDLAEIQQPKKADDGIHKDTAGKN